MEINFTDKNGRTVTITIGEVDGEVLLQLLAKVSDSEFIIKPHK